MFQILIHDVADQQLLLCLCSPVLHRMICGEFSESAGKNLHFHDVMVGGVFGHALDLWCGRADAREMALVEMRELVSVADRFQMLDVVAALEDSMIGQLNVELWCEVLISGGGVGIG